MNDREHDEGIHTSGIDGFKGHNYAWRFLKDVDPFVAFLASNMDFDDNDMGELIARSRQLDHWDIGDPAVVQAACEWVRENEGRWRSWLPRMCPHGMYPDSTLTDCIPCAP
jgi:ABC-type proline/glycine betaine transport system substrate-binding protein